MEKFSRIDLEYRLVRNGVATPTTQKKSWFFAIPRTRDSEAAWTELLHRLFYDANIRMRRREPGDPGWLALDSYHPISLDPANLLAWNGQTDADTTRTYLPWFLSAKSVVWEGSACWIVDDAGRYDALSPYDYSELMIDRLLGTGTSGAAAISFFDKLYRGNGQSIYDDRTRRMANVKIIRAPEPGTFRKTPGADPIASGPPSPADLG